MMVQSLKIKPFRKKYDSLLYPRQYIFLKKEFRN